MQETLESLLAQARDEIRMLRSQNEVLRAKVDTMELFALVLHTRPPGSTQGYSEDIAWKLDREIQSMQAEKANAGNATT